MRLSELAGKELVDIREGIRLGELGQADLVFESRTGRVRAVVVGPHGPWWRRARELVIPWRGVRKIGVDLIVVDLGAVNPEELRSEDARSDYPAPSADPDVDGYGPWEHDGQGARGRDGSGRGQDGPGLDGQGYYGQGDHGQGGPPFFFRRR